MLPHRGASPVPGSDHSAGCGGFYTARHQITGSGTLWLRWTTFTGHWREDALLACGARQARTGRRDSTGGRWGCAGRLRRKLLRADGTGGTGRLRQQRQRFEPSPAGDRNFVWATFDDTATPLRAGTLGTGIAGQTERYSRTHAAGGEAGYVNAGSLEARSNRCNPVAIPFK